MIDERWMREWLAWGFEELERYLANYAAFHDYCKEHDNDNCNTARDTGKAGRPTVH